MGPHFPPGASGSAWARSAADTGCQGQEEDMPPGTRAPRVSAGVTFATVLLAKARAGSLREVLAEGKREVTAAIFASHKPPVTGRRP